MRDRNGNWVQRAVGKREQKKAIQYYNDNDSLRDETKEGNRPLRAASHIHRWLTEDLKIDRTWIIQSNGNNVRVGKRDLVLAALWNLAQTKQIKTLSEPVQAILRESRRLHNLTRNVHEFHKKVRNADTTQEADEYVKKITNWTRRFKGFHPSIILLNAALAHAYQQSAKTSASLSWDENAHLFNAVKSVFVPYMISGGMETAGMELGKKNEQIEGTLPVAEKYIERTKTDVEHKVNAWEEATRQWLDNLKKSLPDEHPIHEAQITIEPMDVKRDLSIAKKIGAKLGEKFRKTIVNIQRIEKPEDVFDFLRSRIIVDHPDEQNAIQICQLLGEKLGEIKHADLPVTQASIIQDVLEQPRKGKTENDAFRVLQAVLEFKTPEKQDFWKTQVPHMEVQICTRRQHEENQKPENQWYRTSNLQRAVLAPGPIRKLFFQ